MIAVPLDVRPRTSGHACFQQDLFTNHPCLDPKQTKPSANTFSHDPQAIRALPQLIINNTCNTVSTCAPPHNMSLKDMGTHNKHDCRSTRRSPKYVRACLFSAQSQCNLTLTQSRPALMQTHSTTILKRSRLFHLCTPLLNLSLKDMGTHHNKHDSRSTRRSPTYSGASLFSARSVTTSADVGLPLACT